MIESAKPSISIITATYNAAALLPRLIESLIAQTDQDFEWVVADGGSTDGTLEILEDAKGRLKNVVVDSRPDFGIYDALNRGLGMTTGAYYVVLGGDDTLESSAIANYKLAIVKSGADLVTARVESNGKIQGARHPGRAWLYGQFSYVSGHAVGLAVKRSLHDTMGLYSRHYPIAADQLFILEAIDQGASVSEHPFVAGRFESKYGASGQDILGTSTEGFRVQVQMGQPLAIQLILLVLRIIKNRRFIGVRK